MTAVARAVAAAIAWTAVALMVAAGLVWVALDIARTATP